MKKQFLLLLSIIFFSLTFALSPSAASGAEPMISVHLSNYLGNQTSIPIKVNGTYKVKEDQSIILENGQDYRVTLTSNGGLELFKGNTRLKTFSSSFTISPDLDNLTDYVFLDNRAYLGKVTFIVQNKFIRPINELPLEDYLKSVVPHEMPASWGNSGGMEALKAQAVAARNYAMRRINWGSTIHDTQQSQVYGGYKKLDASNNEIALWHDKTTQAVSETSGEVLLYGSNLADTFYSSSNGGITESNQNAWGGDPIDYLPIKDDSFDLSLDPHSPWNFTVHQQQFQPGDLNSPSNWWSQTSEINLGLAKLLKEKLKTSSNDIYKSSTDIKVSNVNQMTYTKNSTGERANNATINFSFFLQESNGSTNLQVFNQLQGDNRYQTSKAISEFGWQQQQSVVVIGRGDQTADALTGSVLASKFDAPLLLTQSNRLPESIAAELTRLKPSQIYILGGEAAISKNVETELKKYATSVKRLWGENRSETAANVAKEINSQSKSIILAAGRDQTGENASPDSLAIAPYAGINQIPILLSDFNKLRPEIKKYIQDNKITNVYIIGGESVLSSEIQDELDKLNVSWERIFGKDRYDTAVKIAERFPLNSNKVFFARGDDFADALSATPLAAREQAPILLTKSDQVPDTLKPWLEKVGPSIGEVYFLGGPSAISLETRDVNTALLKERYSLISNGDLKSYTETITIPASKLRTAIGGMVMKSTLLTSNTTITPSNGVFQISGRGFGHGVGMSQYGAYARAKAGKNYQEILGFYYPGTVLQPQY